MEKPRYYIGPYLSCFFAIYSSKNEKICRLTGILSESEAHIKLKRFNMNPYKFFKGVGKVYK